MQKFDKNTSMGVFDKNTSMGAFDKNTSMGKLAANAISVDPGNLNNTEEAVDPSVSDEANQKATTDN